MVDVNVHPAKTEVKFLSEKAVFDCVHYGVLAALNQQTDRPQVRLTPPPAPAPQPAAKATPVKQETFFRTMNAEEYKVFSAALKDAPQPKPEAAAATLAKIGRPAALPLRETVMIPQPRKMPPTVEQGYDPADHLQISTKAEGAFPPAPVSAPESDAQTAPLNAEPEMEQTVLDMPKAPEWRMVGELYNSYIIVEQGEDAFLIDKHAAHERILFEKLKANQEKISAQSMLTPLPVRLSPSGAAELLSNRDMLEELGFEIEEFGENTVLLRQIPMALNPADAADAIETLAADLLSGRREKQDTVRDELLHTVTCKAAIKAGWKNDRQELLAIVREVMAREDLKYCPHGRPICVTLSKKQLEKQFKRT